MARFVFGMGIALINHWKIMTKANGEKVTHIQI